ncbi:MAG: hypothetical protein E6K54_05745 [Gammaproteobacteria bacterium]|nr:MAG: hypothetical protein E6K54_05745 [Gammaproteobacteria bacterium]
MPLSDNKTFFLQYPTYLNYQFPAKAIEPLIKHYSYKNIVFIKNGMKSPKLILEKQYQIQTKIDTLENNLKKYAFYLQSNFCSDEEKNDSFFISNLLSSFFKEEVYPTLKKSIKNFLTPRGELKKNLTEKELSALNTIISKAPYKSLFDKKINRKIAYLKNEKPDVNLTKQECIHEIKAIQNDLKENERVGYIFTNARQLGEEHIEILILTREAIIQPILWPDTSIKRRILDTDIAHIIKEVPVFKTDLSFFVQKPRKLPHPQADTNSCGILSIAFAKKILQKDSLSINSLAMSFYFKEKKHHFFLPPATILRYSQSSRYIDFLEAIIQDQETVVYQDQAVLTIKALLNQSITYAQKINDSTMILDNESTLIQLNLLRTSWLTSSQQVKEKRNAMKLSGENLYLAYTAFRFFSLNKMGDQQVTSTENNRLI